MRYAIHNTNGALEIRVDSRTELPEGAELLTDERYAELTAEPVVVPDPAAEKAAILEQARSIRETVLNRLTGIQVNTTEPAVIVAIQTARQALLDIPEAASVVAATDGASMKVAVMLEWKRAALALATASPSAANAFEGMGM